MKKSWSLNTKMVLVTIFAAVVVSVVLFILISTVLSKGYKRLESENVDSSISQVKESYSYFLNNLDSKISDWSSWDDTYEFIKDKNPDYVKSNLNPETLDKLKVDQILFIDSKDILVQATKSASLKTDLSGLVKDDLILNEVKQNGSSKGLFKIGENNYAMYTAHPILKSDESGEPRGVIIFARLMSGWFSEDITSIIKIPVGFDLTPNNLKDDLETDDQNIIAYFNLPVKNDPDGLRMYLELKREIWIVGRKSLGDMLFYCSTLLLIYTLLNYFIFKIIVVNDLLRFQKEVSDISGEKAQGRIEIKRSSREMDNLREDVNSLLEVVDESRLELTDKVSELDKINKLMVGRENKMAELKETIKELKKKIV